MSFDLASFTPDTLTAWGAAAASVIGIISIALAKALPLLARVVSDAKAAFAAVRSAVGADDGDESLKDVVHEIRDLVRSHGERLDALEAAKPREPRAWREVRAKRAVR